MTESKPSIPQAPAQPAHLWQRKIWLAALIIVLSMAVGAVALFTGVRVILRNIAVSERPGSRHATIAFPGQPARMLPLVKDRPAGEPNPELPVYPGAARVTSTTTSPARLVLHGHRSPGVLDLFYQTSDSASKVQHFYRRALAGVYGFTEEDEKGRTTFRPGGDAQDQIVIFSAANGGARIEFIHVP
ncbi:MAG: hypothetical protein ACRD10_02255 [Terriglobia bacterium]